MIIELINPVTGAESIRNVSGVTQAQVAAWTYIMDHDSIAQTNEKLGRYQLADVTPAQWIYTWAHLVGPVRAGCIILGS